MCVNFGVNRFTHSQSMIKERRKFLTVKEIFYNSMEKPHGEKWLKNRNFFLQKSVSSLLLIHNNVRSSLCMFYIVYVKQKN